MNDWLCRGLGLLTLCCFSLFSFAQNLQNGLIAHYPFKNNARDAHGTHHGQVYGAQMTEDRFGRPNHAYLFDGFNDYIDVPVDAFLTPNYTYSLWAQISEPLGWGTYQYAFWIGGTGADQGVGVSNAANNVTGWIYGSYLVSPQPAVAFITDGLSPTPGRWYHLVAVRETSFIRFYVDGVLVGQATTQGRLPAYSLNPYMAIGARLTSGQFFRGKIDDIRLYDRPLSTEEVTELYKEQPEKSSTTIKVKTQPGVRCGGQRLTVAFDTTGKYFEDNEFRVQLAQKGQSFVDVGGSSTGSPVTVSLPTEVSAEAAYEIRVVASSPSTISDTVAMAALLPPPVASLSGSSTITTGQAAILRLELAGVGPWAVELSNGQTLTNIREELLHIRVEPAGTTSYTIRSVRTAECGPGETKGEAAITVMEPNPANPPNLLAFYPFSGSAQDVYGQNHGQVFGASLTTDRFGRANQAYVFNGFYSYIRVNGASFRQPTYTYSFWAQLDRTPSFNSCDYLLTVGGWNGDQGISISNGGNGVTGWTFGSYLINPVPAVAFVSDGGLPQVGRWYHLTAVREPTQLRFYVNGMLVAQTSTQGRAPYYGIDPVVTFGGRFTNMQDFHFNGKLDDIRIYNRPLTTAEVVALYNLECTYSTIKAGDWNDPTVWACGQIPTLADDVQIRHAIRVPNNVVASARTVSYLDGGAVTLGMNAHLFIIP